MLQSLEEFLTAQAVGFVRIDGETTAKKKDALVTKFQFDNTVSFSSLIKLTIILLTFSYARRMWRY